MNLVEGGFAVIINQNPGSFRWRDGKVVKVIGKIGDCFRVEDAAGFNANFHCTKLEPIELPTVRKSLSDCHHHLTRKRTSKGWQIQTIYADLPDEIMAASLVELTEGYADMVAELERLRAENLELRQSKWQHCPEVEDEITKRIGGVE